jgi:hypothetical protein
MKKTASLIVLVIALPALLSPISVAEDTVAISGAFGGFEELDESNPVIAILGDTQMTTPWEFWFKNNGRQTRAILAEIAGRGPAAIINLGDLVASGASIGDWRTFDELHARVMSAQIPYFAVRGNHEYRGPDERAQDHFGSRLPHLRDRAWHAFRFRYAGIILLDSNFGVLGSGKADEQTRWLEATLDEMEASPDVQVIICCAHHPPYSNSVAHWPYKEVQRRFAAAFQRLKKPGLFFSAHIHTYERFFIGGKHFIVSGGGGGHACRVKTGPGRRVTADIYQGPPVRAFHFCQLQFGLDRLTFQSMHLDEFHSGRFFIADECVLPIERPGAAGPREEDRTISRPPAGFGMSLF